MINDIYRTFFLSLLLSGIINFAAPVFAQAQPTGDMAELSKSILHTIQAHHYHPDELKGQPFIQTWRQVENLAAESSSTDQFVNDFNRLWQNGPFSHVNLSQSPMPAAQLAEYLDNVTVGPEEVSLVWQKDIAVLTITTMMGTDTIDGIIHAYAEIAAMPAKMLIIDLRANEGGAFAILPLVSHLISKPLEAGYFVSQGWWHNHETLPSVEQLQQLEPWQGWSIQSFWQSVTQSGLLKVRFEPQSPHLDMPVFILTSTRTASAAELAIQALQASGRATIIGEPTAGKMLSQKPFDVAAGLQLFVPVADYFSIEGNRIEGHPIQPDKALSAEQALTFALQLANP